MGGKYWFKRCFIAPELSYTSKNRITSQVKMNPGLKNEAGAVTGCLLHIKHKAAGVLLR